jgi:hypothetical protein
LINFKNWHLKSVSKLCTFWKLILNENVFPQVFNVWWTFSVELLLLLIEVRYDDPVGGPHWGSDTAWPLKDEWGGGVL